MRYSLLAMIVLLLSASAVSAQSVGSAVSGVGSLFSGAGSFFGGIDKVLDRYEVKDSFIITVLFLLILWSWLFITSVSHGYSAGLKFWYVGTSAGIGVIIAYILYRVAVTYASNLSPLNFFS